MDDFENWLRLELGQVGRRLRGMAMISRGIVPNLVISQHMVDRVVSAAQNYIEDETGESMVGLVVDTDEPETMPTIYVLDTISPDESVIRRTHMFEQGDDLQGDLFNWLLDNWNAYLSNGYDMQGRSIHPDLHEPLAHVGDWHKQPGYMIQPSGGDLMTALRIMDDEENQFEFLLVPIVTLGHPSVTSEEGAQVNYFSIPMDDGTSLRMDWWYIHRDVRVFQPITPKVVGYDALPQLPAYPWHLLDVDLMDEELNLIEQDGLFLLFQYAVPYQVDTDLPLEICFIVGRGGSNKLFIVATDLDYPNEKPRLYTAPFPPSIDPRAYVYDVFDMLWQKAERVDDQIDFEWNPETSYIVDYVAVAEKTLGMRPDDLPMPWERSNVPAPEIGNGVVNIAVEIDSNSTATPDPPQPTPKAETEDVTSEEESAT